VESSFYLDTKEFIELTFDWVRLVFINIKDGPNLFVFAVQLINNDVLSLFVNIECILARFSDDIVIL